MPKQCIRIHSSMGQEIWGIYAPHGTDQGKLLIHEASIALSIKWGNNIPLGKVVGSPDWLGAEKEVREVFPRWGGRKGKWELARGKG